jgi:hypothetical protein
MFAITFPLQGVAAHPDLDPVGPFVVDPKNAARKSDHFPKTVMQM